MLPVLGSDGVTSYAFDLATGNQGSPASMTHTSKHADAAATTTWDVNDQSEGRGLTLTLMHLIAIPVSNASLNPARSIATAVYGGGDALGQLWVFLVAPVVGGLIAGFTYRFLFDRRRA